jgi:hypothetical protein
MSWAETTDPKSGKIYYYNRSTNETSWTNPQAEASMFAFASSEAAAPSEKLVVSTKLGNIEIKLRTDVAPKTCAAIKGLAEGGYFNGCCIYRAEPNFVIQAVRCNTRFSYAHKLLTGPKRTRRTIPGDAVWKDSVRVFVEEHQRHLHDGALG